MRVRFVLGAEIPARSKPNFKKVIQNAIWNLYDPDKDGKYDYAF